MLTGDKLETAISIGKSTKFLSEGMRTMIVDAEDSSQTGEKLGNFIREVAAGKDDGIEMKNVGDPLSFCCFPSADIEINLFHRSMTMHWSSPERPWFTR